MTRVRRTGRARRTAVGRRAPARGTNRQPQGELGDVMKQVKKRYGDGAYRMGCEVIQPDRISTGSFILDLATLGGMPHNRMNMVVGERHAGKSLQASKLIASAQRSYPDQTPVLIDVEGTFDSVWGGMLGVDTGSLPVVECETGEMAVDIADAVVGSMETSLIVIDSLAALTPMAEVDASAEDALVGVQARLIGRMVRKLHASLIRERKRGHYVTVLFLNQFRMKIGGMSRDPRTIPGGKALEYGTSFQMIIKNKENKGKDDAQIETMDYNEHPYTITKNKLNNGPRTGEFTLIRENGVVPGVGPGEIDNAPTMVTYAKKFGLYTGGGTRWNLEFGDSSYRFGKAAEAEAAIREDEELRQALWGHMIQLQAANQGMPQEFIERIPGFVVW